MKNLTRYIAMAVGLLLAVPFTSEMAAVPGGANSSVHAQEIAVTTTPNTTVKITVAAQPTPEEFYRSAWQAAKDNFLWQDRLTDWHKWEHKFDGQLKNIADAERAINQMLGTLKDGYTYYKDAAVTKSRNTRADAKGTVSYKMLPGKIGYIKITTFSSNHVADEVTEALKQLTGAEAYVIDLRDNGGGLIWQSMRVFSLFVDKGNYSTLKGYRNGAVYKEDLVVTANALEDIENGATSTYTRDANMSGNKPVVILVNADSASASEMFSGAMRDNKRATLVGTRTYGKGIAQITVSLAFNTSVQVTFAQYLTPNGSAVHGKGLTPDIAVNRGANGDLQMEKAIEVLEKELKK